MSGYLWSFAFLLSIGLVFFFQVAHAFNFGIELTMALQEALALTVVVFMMNPCSAVLNIEELSKAKYTLDISNKPMNELEMIPTEGLKLASRHGQTYYCVLPKQIPSATEKEEEKIPKLTPVASLLEPMRHENCLKFSKGWWTYEFCYGKHVIQYHEEEDGQQGDTTYLGYYQSDFDWNKEILEDTSNFRRHKFNGYHSQIYVNGTSCDVINHKRDTEIRYHCDDSSTETYIQMVNEPSTCSYIVTIRTPYICSHPHTRPKHTPKPVDIVCRPVLSKEDYRKFEEMEKDMKERREVEKLSQLETKPNDEAQPLNEFEEMFYSQMMNMLESMLSQPVRKDTDVQEPPVVSTSKEKNEKDMDEERAIKMIERFIVGPRLENLKPFQQRRIVMDVKDLLRLYGHLPTADQARMVEKYVSRFLETLGDLIEAEEEALNFQQRTINGLNSRLMDDISNLPLPDDLDEGQEEEEEKTIQSKPRLSVHLKVTKVKSGKDFDNVKPEDLLSDDVEDQSEYDPSWKKLEEDIGQGLEEAGFESEGGHLEIRLLTNSDTVGETVKLSSEEGEKFRQMLLEVVGGGAAKKNEMKKQRALHDNYNLVWEKDSSSFKSLGNFEEETTDKDDEVKSPKFKL